MVRQWPDNRRKPRKPADVTVTSTRDREDEQQRLAAEFGRADLDPATAARRVTQLRQLVEQTEAAAIVSGCRAIAPR